jgi:hypothetical protein
MESLPKDMPQLQMPNQGSSEQYHAPMPFYGKNGLGKTSLQEHLNAQNEYHAFRQLAETIGASLSALIIFGSILMMLLFSFYSYLIHVVIRGYRFLSASSSITTYNKLADNQRRFS